MVHALQLVGYGWQAPNTPNPPHTQKKLVMPRKPEHDHLVAKLKSYPAWKQGMTLKKRVAQRDEEGEYERDDDGKIVYQIERVPVPAEKRSLMNHQHMSANVQKHFGVLWNQADKCPLFRQEIVRKADENNRMPAYKIDAEGAQITTRANRALSGHTLIRWRRAPSVR